MTASLQRPFASLPANSGRTPARQPRGVGLPDLVEHRLGLQLHPVRQLVEDIGGVVRPAALRSCYRIDLAQRRPEGYGPIAVNANVSCPVFNEVRCPLSSASGSPLSHVQS